MKKRLNAYGSQTILLLQDERLDVEAIRQKKIDLENQRINEHQKFLNTSNPAINDNMVSTPCPQCKGNNVIVHDPQWGSSRASGDKMFTFEIIIADPPIPLEKLQLVPVYTLIRIDFPVCLACERKFGREAILDCL